MARAVYKKAIMTNGKILDVANRADAMDIYTVQSEQRGTLYLWDGNDIGVYYYGALIKLGIEEAQRLCEELQAFIEDLHDFKTMQLEFKGMHSHTRKRGEQICRTTEE